MATRIRANPVPIVELKQEEVKTTKMKISNDELALREDLFNLDNSKILNVDLRCTVCDQNINWMLLLKKQILVHPTLDVLLCEGCLINVTSSNSDSSCLWCGLKAPNSEIFECRKCQQKFCSSCIRQNFGNATLGKMQLLRYEHWVCCMCADPGDIDLSYLTESFFVLRAFCDAAQKMCVEMKKLDERNTLNGSVSECVICTNELETVSELKCKHKFHKSCISEWMKKSRSCPICRSSYVDVKSPT